jgi:hypothetical protein
MAASLGSALGVFEGLEVLEGVMRLSLNRMMKPMLGAAPARGAPILALSCESLRTE